MIRKDLAKIERKLKVKLPESYRELMVARGAEPAAGSDIGQPFYLDAGMVISANEAERPDSSGTGYAFPNWWETFLLVGDDGAGGYYCVRLDNKPGVWMIGSDTDSEKPTRVARSLQAYVKKAMEQQKHGITASELQEAVATQAEQAAEEVRAEPGEPEPSDEEFTWDYRWVIPVIEEKKLKKRLRALGSETIGAGTDMEAARLEFADWLERNGDATWANYIRVRTAIDRSPGDDYADLIERDLETVERLGTRENPEFPGFDRSQGKEGGVTARVRVEESRPVGWMIRAMDALMQATPVRGINFQSHYAEDMAAILKSPPAQHLRWLKFDDQPENGQVGSALKALVKSSVVRTLEQLEIGGLGSEADVRTLAGASFKHLRQLIVKGAIRADSESLLTAPWFRKLHRLSLSYSAEHAGNVLAHLSGMPNLHTLELIVWPTGKMTRHGMIYEMDRESRLASAGEFPALKRLWLNCDHLPGRYKEVFAKAKMPGLSILYLGSWTVSTADIRDLARTSLLDNLRVLSFGGALKDHLSTGPEIDSAALEAIAASPCGPQLRHLSISGGSLDSGGGFASLADSPLTRPGAFPALTSLSLRCPYLKKVTKKDTVAFLRKLATPQLRHLSLLDHVPFDSGCAAALAANTAFANLTRLVIKELAGSDKKVTEFYEKVLPEMARSSNLCNLADIYVERRRWGP